MLTLITLCIHGDRLSHFQNCSQIVTLSNKDLFWSFQRDPSPSIYPETSSKQLVIVAQILHQMQEMICSLQFIL